MAANAAPPSPALHHSFLEIRLNSVVYAVAVEKVREIGQVGLITPLPNSSAYLCGLMNLRGQVLPIVDLKVRLGLLKTPLTRESCVIVIEGAQGPLGVLVDAVTRVVNIPTENLLPTPDSCHLKDRSMVAAIARDEAGVITVLDIGYCLDQTPEGLPAATQTSDPGQDLGLQSVKLLS